MGRLFTAIGLLLACALLSTGARASLTDYVADLVMYPQVLINIRTEGKFHFAVSAAVTAALKQAETALAGTGRVLLGASGTEPVIRVMVEGEQRTQLESRARATADAVESEAIR